MAMVSIPANRPEKALAARRAKQGRLPDYLATASIFPWWLAEPDRPEMERTCAAELKAWREMTAYHKSLPIGCDADYHGLAEATATTRYLPKEQKWKPNRLDNRKHLEAAFTALKRAWADRPLRSLLERYGHTNLTDSAGRTGGALVPSRIPIKGALAPCPNGEEP